MLRPFLILSRLQSGTEEVVRLDEAQAAIKAERIRTLKEIKTRFEQVNSRMTFSGYNIVKEINKIITESKEN